MPASDTQVKTWLKDVWPNATRHWSSNEAPRRLWVRAQPPPGGVRAPRLISLGSNLFSVQPDGLWVALGPSGERATFADCIVIESCNTSQNLHDKRARYSARTLATVVDLRRAWLAQTVPVQHGAPRTRLALTGCTFPDDDSVHVGLRYLRVLYALPEDNDLYGQVKRSLVLEAHEYICPQNRLGQWHNPLMQNFLLRLAPRQQHMT